MHWAILYEMLSEIFCLHGLSLSASVNLKVNVCFLYFFIFQSFFSCFNGSLLTFSNAKAGGVFKKTLLIISVAILFPKTQFFSKKSGLFVISIVLCCAANFKLSNY